MTGFTPIEIRSAHLSATLLPRGAALVGLRLGDQRRNLVLGFADPADHGRVPVFAGALAGPVANRVRDGKVLIEGQHHQMPLNEAGRTTLHSGPDGLHAQDWAIAAQKVHSVTMTCTLPDGCNGLPGNRTFTATYAITDTTLRLQIEVVTDRATPINVAAHPYWNLDGHADVAGHTLCVAADAYLLTDVMNLPTGEIARTADTIFDFRYPAPVPLDAALDVNFCLTSAMRATPEHAATLRGTDGTTLDVATTCPGLQVYNGSFLPAQGPATADGPALAPYAGIALEPQHWPDAPHHAHFPSIVVGPGQTYRQITNFRLTAP